jgi:hypothetical protein
VAAAKEEFMKEFERAVSGLLVELAPSPVKAQVPHSTYVYQKTASLPYWPILK